MCKLTSHAGLNPRSCATLSLAALLEESDEDAIKFLGLGILTPKAKKDILEIVSKGENYALSAAVLEAINDGKGAKIPNNKFSI